jgi:hypothetical protein
LKEEIIEREKKRKRRREEEERKTKVISFYVPFGILSAFF